MTAEGLRDGVLHRDGLMLIIDKPVGMPVHAGLRESKVGLWLIPDLITAPER